MKVDLRSDTVTIPTKPMLEAMFSAKVGDDVFGEDPTVSTLETKLATMFGKEEGLFCPSGTMTNQIGIRLHTQPGDEIICHKDSHVYKYEGGGIAVNSHCSVRLLDGKYGHINAESILANINNPNDVHFPQSRLVVIEDTSNRGGGSVYDWQEIQNISATCKEAGLALHLDGARVFNALVTTGIDYKEYGKAFGTISVCLSKGLGAPVGSILIGNKDQIKKARRIRKVLGGGMRQAGYLAAAGIYALDHNIERLKEDHSKAKFLAEYLKKCSFVEQMRPVVTNIVIFDLAKGVSAKAIADKLREKNILTVPISNTSIRMVTHLGIDDAMIMHVANALTSMV